jgi:hypothetical protein
VPQAQLVTAEASAIQKRGFKNEQISGVSLPHEVNDKKIGRNCWRPVNGMTFSSTSFKKHFLSASILSIRCGNQCHRS